MNRQFISFVFLFLFAMSCPLMADVTFTLVEAGDWIVRINVAIDGGAVVRGMALKVTLTDATLEAVTDVTNINPFLNAYIDYYAENETYLDEMDGDETLLPGSTGDGLSMDAHPVADPNGPGIVPSLPATVFSLSFGALDNGGTQGGLDTGGVVCDIYLNISSIFECQVCIEPDMLRGGIVGDNLGLVDAEKCAIIYAPPGPCGCLNDNLGNLNEFLLFECPQCWCYERNCEGDADGKSQGTPITGYAFVSTNDLNVLVAAWQVKEPPKGPGARAIIYNGISGICADFARDAQGTPIAGYARVGTNDLPILVNNWQIKESPKGPGVPRCPLILEGGEINYYTYPYP